jgi:hypothetical protein
LLASKHFPYFTGGFIERFLLDIGQHDLGALASEAEADATADTAGAAVNNRDFIFDNLS